MLVEVSVSEPKIVQYVNIFNFSSSATVPKLPKIETIENCMKLSPMILQGLWEFKSPLLQLPFITDDNIRMFSKANIKNIQQLAKLSADESKKVMKHLSDFERENLMRVLGTMPLIDFSHRCEGIVV